MYITTAGIGRPIPGVDIVARHPCGPAIKVLLSGPIGDHGITILLARGELDLEAELCSDTRSGAAAGGGHGGGGRAGHSLDARSHARRRGHFAERAGARLRPGHLLWPKNAFPIRDSVRGACELLGLDPLHIANEGQFLAVVAPEYRRCRAGTLCSDAPGGQAAAIIGEVRAQPAGTVLGDQRCTAARA